MQSVLALCFPNALGVVSLDSHFSTRLWIFIVFRCLVPSCLAHGRYLLNIFQYLKAQISKVNFKKLFAVGMPYPLHPRDNSFSSTDDSWCPAPGLPLLANQTNWGPEIWCKKAIVGPPPPHPGSSPSLTDDKLRLCLGKVQCYISDLADPKTPGMEGKKKKKSSFYHYSLHIQANLYLKHPNITFLVCFSLSLRFLPKSLNLPFTLWPEARPTLPPLYLLLSFFSVHQLILYNILWTPNKCWALCKVLGRWR